VALSGVAVHAATAEVDEDEYVEKYYCESYRRDCHEDYPED